MRRALMACADSPANRSRQSVPVEVLVAGIAMSRLVPGCGWWRAAQQLLKIPKGEHHEDREEAGTVEGNPANARREGPDAGRRRRPERRQHPAASRTE